MDNKTFFNEIKKDLSCIDKFAANLGLVIDSFDGKELIGIANVEEGHLNAAGMVHGGYLSVMADTMGVMAFLVSDENIGENYSYGVTLSSNINYFRPGKITPLKCKAWLIKKGSHINVCQVDIHDNDGVLIASAIQTYYFSCFQ